ncbi:YfbK domain-containing protein [Corallococcus silvisoli]|uniref:YfbK domain-containing protein n=1 Tax=Corallococcus silvisoli TaxID=2697031 RepID=UPI001377E8A9|nr:von Willebrand factor type A domain-containing protein [Corallococcus silvisoli]NBD08577.1 DUF3520 domain-containing protein [Corallococcus silvisoli]
MKVHLPGLLVALLVVFTSPVLAQSGAEAGGSSVILGTVIDAVTKEPLPDVVVTVTSRARPDLRLTSVTGTMGRYRIPLLPAGVYTLTFKRQAYETAAREGVQLNVRRILRVNTQLIATPLLLAETVEVTGSRPSIDIGSTSQGVNIDLWALGDHEDPCYTAPESTKSDFDLLAGRSIKGEVDTYDVLIKGGKSIKHPLPDTRGYRVAFPICRRPWDMDIAIPDGRPHSLFYANFYTTPIFRKPHPRDVARESIIGGYFKGYGVNPTVDTKEERFSTFSVDVDTASYVLTRHALGNGGAPPSEQAVRVEEFVNAFDYDSETSPDTPFHVTVEGFPSPARKGYQVVHVGVKARKVNRAPRKPSHLVFVVDVDSSSARNERGLELVKQALRLLVDELDERDRVSIVSYTHDEPHVLGTSNIRQKQDLLSAIDSLGARYHSDTFAGIDLGYEVAANHLVEDGNNRVILCAGRGALSSHDSSQDAAFWARVKQRAAAGITLSTVSIGGMGADSDDESMKRLAREGGGNSFSVDRLDEALRGFVLNLRGPPQEVAHDVKLQVEFDRETVSRYRLMGYERRLLNEPREPDDSVRPDAVVDGHSVTALYEVKLRDPSRPILGTLRIRYQPPEGGPSQLIEKALPSSQLRPDYGQATSPTRLSYVAAAFAEKLRGSYWVRPLSYEALVSLWEAIGAPLKDRPDVVELGDLIRTVQKQDGARNPGGRKDRFEAFAPLHTMDPDREPSLQ